MNYDSWNVMNMNKKPGLRVRQRKARKEAILAAANSLFSTDGFDVTSVQSIADRAMVSAQTVYTYFGSKAAIVMAIIVEADADLMSKADALVQRCDGNPAEDMKALLSLMVSESLKTMDEKTWRQVLAMSILDPDNEVSAGYKFQNARLYNRCEDLLIKCVAAGTLPDAIEVKLIRGICEHLNHALFEQLLSGEIPDFAHYEMLLQEYLKLALHEAAEINKNCVN